VLGARLGLAQTQAVGVGCRFRRPFFLFIFYLVLRLLLKFNSSVGS
jgi:hypothetical protein